MIDLDLTIALSATLFGLGILGVFARRSVVAVLLSLDLMLCSAALALVAFDYTVAYTIAAADRSAVDAGGQGFAVLILTVATAQTIVGLGLLVARRHNRDSASREDAGPSPW